MSGKRDQQYFIHNSLTKSEASSYFLQVPSEKWCHAINTFMSSPSKTYTGAFESVRGSVCLSALPQTVCGSTMRSTSQVWDAAPVEIKFCALNLTFSEDDFCAFTRNYLLSLVKQWVRARYHILQNVRVRLPLVLPATPPSQITPMLLGLFFQTRCKHCL